MTCSLPSWPAPPRSRPGTWLFGAAAAVGLAISALGLAGGESNGAAVVASVVTGVAAVLPLLGHLRVVPFACPIRTLSWALGVLLVAFGAWTVVGLAGGRPPGWADLAWPVWGALVLTALVRTRASASDKGGR